MKKNNKKSSKKLVTHNGSFHADDIFAAATLSLYLEKQKKSFEIIRTRDSDIIARGDYVFDVGGAYEPKNNRFDHHQISFKGKRENGIMYSSFGLVWKKFGIEVSGSKKVADIIEKKLVMPIDAWDNGFSLVENKYDISPYFIQSAFTSMGPTWREDISDEDARFLKCVELTKFILSREIIQATDIVLAEESLLSIYQNTQDKRIIVLEKNYPFEFILYNYKEPIFVIYPRKDGSFGVKTIREDPNTFKNRKDLPKAWGGLQGEELQKFTGVPDAVFCHRGLFMAVAKTKEGAIKLAELALSDKSSA